MTSSVSAGGHEFRGQTVRAGLPRRCDRGGGAEVLHAPQPGGGAGGGEGGGMWRGITNLLPYFTI